MKPTTFICPRTGHRRRSPPYAGCEAPLGARGHRTSRLWVPVSLKPTLSSMLAGIMVM